MANDNGDTWGANTTKFGKPDEWNPGSTENWNDGVTKSGTGAGDFEGFGNPSSNAFEQGATGNATYGNGGSGCFNCGEEGHVKAECPNPLKPREFTGTCNHCGEVGHQARACPSKPKVCKQCYAENDHDTIDCKNKKIIDRSRVEDKSVQEAWALLKEASDETEVGEFRDAVQVLAKALDGKLPYRQVEEECRKRNFNIHLIALKKEVAMAYTNVDLEGNVGKTYTLGYFTSPSCPRPVLLPLWPKDAAENLDRLADVGVPMERGVPICGNCNNIGHVRKDCTEDRNVFEGPKVTCALCDEPGHRVRDCPQERPQRKERAPRTCKICGSEDHIAKECDNRPPEICHNCYQEGHRKSDCTNEKIFKCNNCEELGHTARECKAPKDWSKHKCRHCGEYGHGSENRCDSEKKAAFAAAKTAEEIGNGDNFGAEAVFNTEGGDYGSNTNGFSAEGAGQADWKTTTGQGPMTVGAW